MHITGLITLFLLLLSCVAVTRTMGDERVDRLQYVRDYVAAAQANVLKSASLAAEAPNITSTNYVAKEMFGTVNGVQGLLSQPCFKGLFISSAINRWAEWGEKALNTSSAVYQYFTLPYAHGGIAGENGTPVDDGAPMDQALDGDEHGDAHGDAPGQGDDDDEQWMEPAAVHARTRFAVQHLMTSVDEHLTVLQDPTGDPTPAGSAVVAALVAANLYLPCQAHGADAEPVPAEFLLRAAKKGAAIMASLASLLFANIFQTIDAALVIAGQDGEGAGDMQADASPLLPAVPVVQLTEAELSNLHDALDACSAAKSRVEAGLKHAADEAARQADVTKGLAESWIASDPLLNGGVLGAMGDVECEAAKLLTEAAAARHNQTEASALSDAASKQTAYLGREQTKTAMFKFKGPNQYASDVENEMVNDLAAHINLVHDVEIPLWALLKNRFSELLQPLYPYGHPDFQGNSGSWVKFPLLRKFLPQYFEDKPEDETATNSAHTDGDKDYKPPTTSNFGALSLDRLLFASVRAATLAVATDKYGLKGVSIPNYTNTKFVPIDESFCKAFPDAKTAVVNMIDRKLASYELPLYDKEHRALSHLKNQLQTGQVTVADLAKQETFVRFQLQAPPERVTYRAMLDDGLYPLTTFEQLVKAIVDASGIYTPGNDFFILVDKVAKVAQIDENWLKDAVKNGRAYVEAIKQNTTNADFLKKLNDATIPTPPNSVLLSGSAMQAEIDSFHTETSTNKLNAVQVGANTFDRLIFMFLKPHVTPQLQAYCVANNMSVQHALTDFSDQGFKIRGATGMTKPFADMLATIDVIDKGIPDCYLRHTMGFAAVFIDEFKQHLPSADTEETPAAGLAAESTAGIEREEPEQYGDVTWDLVAELSVLLQSNTGVPRGHSDQSKSGVSTHPHYAVKWRSKHVNYVALYQYARIVRPSPELEKGKWTQQQARELGIFPQSDLSVEGRSISRQWSLNFFAGSKAGNLAVSHDYNATGAHINYPNLHVIQQSTGSLPVYGNSSSQERYKLTPPTAAVGDQGWQELFLSTAFYGWGKFVMPVIEAGGAAGQEMMDHARIMLLRAMGVADRFILGQGGMVDVQKLWPAFRDSQTQACPPELQETHAKFGEWVHANIFYLSCDVGKNNLVALVDAPRATQSFNDVNAANAAWEAAGRPQPRPETGRVLGSQTMFQGYDAYQCTMASRLHNVTLTREEFAVVQVDLIVRDCDSQFGPLVINGSDKLPRGAQMLHLNGVSVLNRTDANAVGRQWQQGVRAGPPTGDVLVHYYLATDSAESVSPTAPTGNVNLLVTKRAVMHARRTAKNRTEMFNEGLVLWAEDHFQAQICKQSMAAARVQSLTQQLDTDLSAETRARVRTELKAAQKDHAQLTSAIDSQGHVRRKNGSLRGVSKSDAVALAKVYAETFDSHVALLKLRGPRLRRANSLRLTTSVTQKVANAVVCHAYACAALRGPVHFAPIIIVGDGKVRGACIDMSRVWKLVSKYCLVFFNANEFRTTHLGMCCGGPMHKPPVGKARVGRTAWRFNGTLRCGDRNCPSKGRFLHRDLQAACNIAGVFVCSFVLGGFLGGFSRCEALAENGQLVNPNQRLSMLRLFKGTGNGLGAAV